jgi:hypothetical protein
MLDGLAFLPVNMVGEGMQYLKQNIPQSNAEKLSELVDYFDVTYVSGGFRNIRILPTQAAAECTVKLRRLNPLFPPVVWNVHDATLAGGARTNNLCESWNYGFQQLVGHANPSVWTCIDSIRKDEAIAATLLLQTAQGLPHRKRVKRATADLQRRLANICQGFCDKERNIEELLKAVGHVIRYK